MKNSILHTITGGTFLAEGETSHVIGVQAFGQVKEIDSEIVTSAMGASSTADESLSGKTTLGGKKEESTPGVPGTPDQPVQPPIPVGHTPWLLMLLFAAGYGIFLTKKSHQA